MVAISDGLLTAEHYRKMGKARWVFDWFVSRVTKEMADGEGGYDGVVCHGKPVAINDIARHYGISHRTVQRDIQSLKKAKYIDCPGDVAGKAIPYVVKNSKKYLWQRLKESTSKAATTPKPAEPANARHSPAEKLIKELFEKRFKLACPWNETEGKALKTLLKDNPAWQTEQIESMIRNRFESEINPDRPRMWLPNLAKYASGPLDKYHKPKQGTARAPMVDEQDPYELEMRAKLRSKEAEVKVP